MARITFGKSDDYALKLSRLAAGSDEIVKKAIHAGAGIVADEIKKNLRAVVSGEATGDLENSLGITPIKLDKNGDWNAKIGFDGYDSKGVPNQLKARVLESGRSDSKHRKTRFVSKATRASKAQAVAKMGEIVNDETGKLWQS